VARAILQRHPQAKFIFAAASPRNAEMIGHALRLASFQADVATESNGEILSAADLTLCASGTATLEVAWYGVPMVVMYNGSKWGYRLVGRFLVSTSHLSLVNILADERLVPEFMPYYTSTAPIAAEALDLLTNAPRRQQIKAGLEQVIRSLGTRSAATGAAQIAVDLPRRK
jgi:lipid-A-disaccharide synthase